GPITIEAGHGLSKTVDVVRHEQCTPLAPTGLRVVGPDPALRQGTPPVYWAVVSGRQRRCCGPPLPAVEAEVRTTDDLPAGFDLELLVCETMLCDCVPEEEIAFEAWHPFIDPPRGRHVLRAGPHVVEFDVP
ncbi:MAG: hypothetical protein RMK74_12265, partial [Myxococcales bacterium]|nr:hypothetical protein [Myxococcales bacterium]